MTIVIVRTSILLCARFIVIVIKRHRRPNDIRSVVSTGRLYGRSIVLSYAFTHTSPIAVPLRTCCNSSIPVSCYYRILYLCVYRTTAAAAVADTQPHT